MKKTNEGTPVNPLPENVDAIPRPANELDGGSVDLAQWPKDKATKRLPDRTRRS